MKGILEPDFKTYFVSIKLGLDRILGAILVISNSKFDTNIILYVFVFYLLYKLFGIRSHGLYAANEVLLEQSGS